MIIYLLGIKKKTTLAYSVIKQLIPFSEASVSLNFESALCVNVVGTVEASRKNSIQTSSKHVTALIMRHQ